MRESYLQGKLIKGLRAKGWFAIKTDGVGLAGFPDVFTAKGGRVVLLEVKSDTGRLSPAQKAMHELLARQAVECYVLKGEDECAKYVINAE